jgi:hypothetical protein
MDTCCDTAVKREAEGRPSDHHCCVATPTLDPVEQMRVMLAGHIVAQCLHATALLGIADLIEKGHRTIGDLAAETGTHAPSLHRMLRILASLGGIARSTPSAARVWAITVCVPVRARRSDDAQKLPCPVRPHWCLGQDALPHPPAHVAPRLRLCAGQCRPRHQGAAGMARAQEHSAHRALHRAGAGQVQELLAIGDLWR